jgi:predicted amidohydrolase
LRNGSEVQAGSGDTGPEADDNRREEGGKMLTMATVLSGRYPYDEALDKARIWIEEAADRGADCICFPEYYFDYEVLPDGTGTRGISDESPLVTELTALARKYPIAIVMGLTEKVRNRRFDLWDYYNSALFIDGKGIRGRHRKVFLWVDAEWDEERKAPGNKGNKDYFYPPLADERHRYLPGWSFECFAFGPLDRVCGMICADGLMPPAWSHVIPLSPQVIFYPNGRLNLLKRWGPDLGHISKKYSVPIVASNSNAEGEAGIFDSDGRCVARIEGTTGIAVAKVTVGQKQPYEPVTTKHWEGEPMEMLNRLDKF